MYNILTGKEPFDLFSTDIQVKVLGDLPELIREFIIKGTKYEAEERFQSAAEMSAALEELYAKLHPGPETVTPLPVPPSLQGDLGDLLSAQPSVETFDSSMLPSDELGSGVHGTDYDPKNYDHSLYPTETQESSAQGKFGVLPMVGVALLIAAGVGWGLTQGSVEPAVQAPVMAPAPVVPKGPSIVDDLAKKVDGIMVAEKVDATKLAGLQRESKNIKIKLEAENETVDTRLENLIGGDSEVKAKLDGAAKEAGSDLDKLGQSTFLSGVSPDIRALFIRQQELQIQSNELRTQMLILERVIAAEEKTKAAEKEARAAAEAAALASKAKKTAASVEEEAPIDRSTLPRGTLIINSFPWGSVSLDGESLGRTPQRIETWSGRHTLRIESADGRRHSGPVSVRANGETAFCWSFDDEAKCQ
jgi:hypothetical protein